LLFRSFLSVLRDCLLPAFFLFLVLRWSVVFCFVGVLGFLKVNCYFYFYASSIFALRYSLFPHFIYVLGEFEDSDSQIGPFCSMDTAVNGAKKVIDYGDHGFG
jgi:hypothetical protein